MGLWGRKVNLAGPVRDRAPCDAHQGHDTTGAGCSFDAGNYPSVQKLTAAAGDSRFYAHFSDQLRDDITTLPLTMQNHHFGEPAGLVNKVPTLLVSHSICQPPAAVFMICCTSTSLCRACPSRSAPRPHCLMCCASLIDCLSPGTSQGTPQLCNHMYMWT